MVILLKSMEMEKTKPTAHVCGPRLKRTNARPLMKISRTNESHTKQ